MASRGWWFTLAIALLLTGCSTPGMRARHRRAAFSALSKEDQRLVLHGHLRRGLNKDAVYIAWGRPTDTIVSDQKSGTLESWQYISRWSAYAPINGQSDGGYFAPVLDGGLFRAPVATSGVHFKKAVFINGKLSYYDSWWQED